MNNNRMAQMKNPSHGQFDSTSKSFYNANTGKWVKRIRPSVKGKLVGKALGVTKGNALLKKYKELGMPKKHLQIPVNVDIDFVKTESNKRKLNHEYCLFILHKLLYNRARLRKSLRSSTDYENNFTPLSSRDIQKWIGKHYAAHIQLLIDINYLIPKLSSNGNLSYWNAKGSSDSKSKTACYKINPELLSRDLFVYKPTFKSVPLSDVKLTVKLHQQHLTEYSSNEVVTILQAGLRNVRFHCSIDYLNKHFLPDEIEEVLLVIHNINSGNIYVRSELDSFGERFHSSFTFLWSKLRPLLLFDNSSSDLIYLDLSNSQYFFFSLLIYEQTYKELIPEFEGLKEIISNYTNNNSFKTFIHHAQKATLYNYVDLTYGLKKLDLMKLFFAKGRQYKKIRMKCFPWLQSLIESSESTFGSNILPRVLQRLESRSVLLRVCIPFLKENKGANLISIHDGILFEKFFYEKIVQQLNVAFAQLNLPVPEFKTVKYENVIIGKN